MSLPGSLSSPTTVIGLLRRNGLAPQKRLGQNFLVDANVLARIVDAGMLEEGGQVFEIGAGLGVLTQALCERVGPSGHVATVEIDRGLLELLAQSLANTPQLSIIGADVLSLDLASTFAGHFDPAAPVAVVANIPYQITSPLIAALLEQKGRISRMVFLVQREVALRLAAAPGAADYGAFTLFCQYHSVVENLFNASRTVFYPAPEVSSAVIRLTPRPAGAVDVSDEEVLFAVIRAAFGQRRKVIGNALAGDPALGWSKERAHAALVAAGIDPRRRGETLSLPEFASVADAGANVTG
jgi:16S rRNA (adenine1518-N6/adenine1519-N6)-dimethyltransferase